MLKITNGTTLYVTGEKPPSFFVDPHGNLYPTLYTLWKMPDMMEELVTHGPVSKFLLPKERSAGAAPFTALLSVCALWFLVHAPLVFLGAYAGEKKDAPEQPTRTNKIPRRVPPQPWYLRGAVTALAGGALPFAAVVSDVTKPSAS